MVNFTAGKLWWDANTSVSEVGSYVLGDKVSFSAAIGRYV
jgi:hypothetical protein